jgi:hypothetical protein
MRFRQLQPLQNMSNLGQNGLREYTVMKRTFCQEQRLSFVICSIALLTACSQSPVEPPKASVPPAASASPSPFPTGTSPEKTVSAASGSTQQQTPVASPTASPATSSTQKPATPAASAVPLRVNFSKGATSTTLNGEVGRYGAVKYVLGAAKSQTMKAEVSSSCKSVTLDVSYLETGFRLTKEPVTTFKDTLVSAGDYIVQVQNSDLPSCQYKLTIDIQ